ncbi:hypothetical protein ACFP3I_01675 [Chryseobacterium arachidis]|uniref:hypothetical protein n=1 Tax=Chryseobacterium arachidis TaxID=1416778 RepID=UPI0036194AA5
MGIIILYNPDIKNVLKNISKFIDHIDHLIIWQNSSCEGLEKMVGEYSNKLTIMGNKNNQGIAYPLNVATNRIKESSSFTHLLTMDQDSEWQNFDSFIDTVSLLDNHSIYSPNINNENNDCTTNTKKVNDCITSGALFSKYALDKINGFNEVYSVDCVDYDFSYKATANGINIYKICNARMVQTYGAPQISKYFGIKSNVYSAQRSYFIVRNHMLLWKDHNKYLSSRFKINILKHYIFVRIVKIIMMEDHKIKKISSIIRGLFDGLMNNRSKKYT